MRPQRCPTVFLATGAWCALLPSHVTHYTVLKHTKAFMDAALQQYDGGPGNAAAGYPQYAPWGLQDKTGEM